ncbi:5'-nucleotidase C-terminal domain-containing protein [Citricoccus muralis]|uniref:5'-nucleotidase C-terminal domain-containing protein n=1 Tax=Citricoccus muralis TaxID=169134 RepID=UPI001FE383D7|nr:5'-nucleotidase C-terminal domain-containing protein [Citricoccus muralis]
MSTDEAVKAAAEPAAEGTEKISILSFNDFHGALSEEYAGTLFSHTVEGYRTAFETANGEGSTLLTSAGDLIGASASVSNVQADEPTLEIMNQLGLAVSAAGNHEFDKGLDDLTGRVADIADFNFLAANFVDPETKEPVITDHEIFEVDGVDVAVIGAVPNNLYATTTGSGLQGNEVIDLVEAVNGVAEEIEAAGTADVIVATYHDGASGNGDLATEVENSAVFDSIVNGTDESVDVIFNGHTHQTYNYETTAGETERPVVQAGQSGNLLATVELTIDSETKEVVDYSSDLVERTPTPMTGAGDDATFDPTAMDALVADSTETVQAIYETEQAAVAEFDELKNTVIGEMDSSITTDYQTRIEESGAWRAGGTRRQESTLGNWAANALKDRISLSNPEVDLGVTNSGGLRAELLHDRLTDGGKFPNKAADMVGKVSLGEILDLAPFGNTLTYFDIPGSSLKQVLEENWQEGNKTLHLGWSEELTWTYDESRPQDDKVTGIWISGEPVSMDEMYTIGTLSFLADDSWVGTENSAPDGYEGFAIGQENKVDLGIMDNQAFQEYVQAETAAAGDIRPDFAKKAVEVKGATGTAAPGAQLSLTLENLEMDSDGAGDATSVSVAFQPAEGEAVEVGTVDVAADGESADLSTLQAPETTGVGELVMTVAYDDAYESTTEVRSALTIGTDVPKDFTDNQPGSVYYAPVRWMQAADVTTGYTDGTYRKAAEITRGESVAFLQRYLAPDYTTDPAEAVFPDVPAGAPHFTPIAWAADDSDGANGAGPVSEGYADGTFRPGQDVTRAEFVTFLYRAADPEGFTAPEVSVFPDVPSSGSYYEAISWAAAEGLVNGYHGGEYRPYDPISRGEVAKVMHQYDLTDID